MKKINIFLFFVVVVNSSLFAQTKEFDLAAEMNKTVFLSDGSSTEFWGFGLIKSNGAYSATLPGPVLNINLGDTVKILLYNDSPEDHTIHLHGLDVDQANDGVPSTSFSILSQDTAEYNFVATHTGTFIYHCHVLTMLHLTMGMYGMIVVHNYPDSTKLFDGGPSFTNEYHFLTTDMDRSWNDNPLSVFPMYEFKADYFMVNGLNNDQLYFDPQHHVKSYPNDSTSLRLANIAYSKVVYIFPPELNAISYLSDGRVLPTPLISDTLVMYPGERYSVLLTPTIYTDTDIQVEYYEMRNNNKEHTNYIKVNGDLSISEKDEEISFVIYPNPTNNFFNFETSFPNNHLKIFSLSGELIYEKFIPEKKSLISVENLKTGIYIVQYNESIQKLIVY